MILRKPGCWFLGPVIIHAWWWFRGSIFLFLITWCQFPTNLICYFWGPICLFFSSFASLRQFSLFDFIVLHQIIYLDLCIKDKANGWLLLLLCIQCLFPLCLVFLMKITAMVIVAPVVYDFTYPKTEKGISHEI